MIVKNKYLIKIKKAKTDALPLPENEEDLKARPEAKNLLGIYSSLHGQDLKTTIKNFLVKIFRILKINYQN